MDIYTNSDNQFLYEQVKAGQKKALFKNSVVLGILLICYDVFLEISVYGYYYFYYTFKTGKFSLKFNIVRDYIVENIENNSVTEFEMLGNAFVTFVSLMGILIVARFFFKLKVFELIKCNRQGIKIGVKAFPFSLLLNYFFTVLIAIVTSYFASFGVVIPDAEFVVDDQTFIAGFSMFLYMVVLAPIIEEIVYRGFVLKLISPYGKTVSIILSAFIFGFMHGNLSQFVTAFATGIIFSAIAVKTNSIGPTIIMHMLNNGINFIAICGEDYNSEVCTVIYLILFTAVLLLGIMEIFLFRKVIKNKPQETTLLSKKESWKAIIVNPAMLLYFAYLAYTFIENIILANI